MIISAGYNIAGPEVEDVLLRHPAVAECGVIGRPDEERGQIVEAHVVLKPGLKPRRIWACSCRSSSRSRSRRTNIRARSFLTRCRARKPASCSVSSCAMNKESRMNIVCIGGGPAGLYFSLLMKKQNPAHQVTVVERNRPYDTFGWGVVFSDQTLGNLANADEPTARAILRRSTTGTTSMSFSRARRSPRAATVFAASAASICSTSCSSAARNWACRWCSRRRCGRPGDRRALWRRPGDRLRRLEQPHPHALCGQLPAADRAAPVPLRVAGHAQEVRRLYLRVQGDRAWLVPGPHLPVRRRHLDLHRRDAGTGVARGRPGGDEPGAGDRLLRASVCGAAGRHG
jgi:hypothetical protein